MKTDITRREFGQLVGTAAVSAVVPAVLPAPGVASPVPIQNAGSELCYMSAVELADRIRKKQVSARDVMAAHLAQIERMNPRVNAIVTLVADRAMADAARADEMLASGRSARRAARAAGRAQGPGRYGRHPDDARVAVLPGQRADARRADRDADPRGRRA